MAQMIDEMAMEVKVTAIITAESYTKSKHGAKQ